MHNVVLAAVLHGLQSASPPNPGTGTPPPGFDKVNLILKWLAWLVAAACVAGILIVGGQMALRHQRGEGGQHVAGLAWVLAACVLVAAASGIVGFLV